MERSKEERSKDKRRTASGEGETPVFFKSILSLIALRENPPGHPPAAPKARHREYPQVIFVLFIRRTADASIAVCAVKILLK
ncbi:hypothetical protein HR10_03550 [Porphyromonas gulae]|nr:hypothetical protein HR10_03550 [Porphyromonas gulae]